MQLFNPLTQKYVEATNLEHWGRTQGYGIAEIEGIRVKYTWVEEKGNDLPYWIINATDATKLLPHAVNKVDH